MATAAERKRQQRERQKRRREVEDKEGIVRFEVKSHKDDKQGILDHVKRKNKKRGILQK